MVVTLLITGLIGLGAASFLADSAQGFLMSRASGQAFQKTGIALERLLREFKHMDTISQASNAGIVFGRTGTHFGLSLVGTDLKLIRDNSLPGEGRGSILLDHVSGFELDFFDADGNAWAVPGDMSLTGLSRVRIRVTVTVYDTASRTFTLEVNPLYNNTVNGPVS